MCMIISQLLYTVNNNLLISFVLFLCWEFYCTDISLATDLHSRVMFYFSHQCSTWNICAYWFMAFLRRAKSPLVPRVEKSTNSDCVGCATAVDFGRSNIFTPIERAWTLVCPRSEILLLPRLFWKFALLL